MQQPIIKQNRSSRAGQTLIEVMISLFVLTTGFLGILSLLSQSLFLSKTTSDETIATYLASEGIELAKNIIDHDVYQHLSGLGTGWAQGSPDTAFGPSCAGGQTGGDFQLDYMTCTNLADSSVQCCPPQNQDTPLLFDPATDLYSYVGGPGLVQTSFTRDIKVGWTASNPNQMTVQSIVSWSTGPFTSQSVQLEDYFYNWRSS